MVMKVKALNLDELWDNTNRKMWGMTNEDLDFYRPGVTAHSFHNQLFSESASVTRSITTFGYTKTKWSMLLRLYFEPESYKLLIHRLKHYKSESRGKKYIVDIPLKFKDRNNASGACLIGMTFRFSLKYGWEVEVFTRASESVSRWGVDLVFLHVLVREIGKEIGFDPAQVRVYWNSANMFQSILTTPLWLAITGRWDEFDKTPKSRWQEDVQKRYRKAFATDERKYKSYKSQRRAVDAFDVLLGDKESKLVLPVSDLWLPKVDLDDVQVDPFKRGGFK